MIIKKKYKIEEVTTEPKDFCLAMEFVHLRKSKAGVFAEATNGRALARVPVDVDSFVDNWGVKNSTLAYRRKDPTHKKQTVMGLDLVEIPQPYPATEGVFPAAPPVVTFSLDVDLLVKLSRALGTSKLTFAVVDDSTAIRVSAIGDSAHGLIMPYRTPKK